MFCEAFPFQYPPKLHVSRGFPMLFLSDSWLLAHVHSNHFHVLVYSKLRGASENFVPLSRVICLPCENKTAPPSTMLEGLESATFNPAMLPVGKVILWI